MSDNTAVAEQQSSQVLSADDFLRGQRDCAAGNPHRPNQSHDYDRGYSAQYTSEQIKSEMGGRS